jgi:hypothetical protein
MAKALRSDLVGTPRWDTFVKAAHARLDAFYPEKCPNCDVHYTMLLSVVDNAEDAVNLLRVHLSKECPQHQYEVFIINEGPNWGRVVPYDEQ